MVSLRVAVVGLETAALAELRALLESAGHTVYEADKGDHLLHLANEWRPDAFLVGSAAVALHEPGEEEETPLADRVCGPIILLADEANGASPDKDADDGLSRIGAFATLTRPFRAAEILLTLSAATERYRDLRACHDSIHKLQTRLSDRVIVEKAKWILIQRDHLSEQEAYRRVHFAARSTNRSMRMVAEEVIAAAEAATAASPQTARAARPGV